jgi:hypothetical protein
MVTAIVIPILILYFFFSVINERRKHFYSWKELSNINEEAILSGEIRQVVTSVETYVGKYKIFIVRLLIQSSHHSNLQVIQKQPIIDNSEISNPFKEGQFITCSGVWEGKTFLISRFEIKEQIHNK